jgi:hypothetical protein
MRKHHDQNLHKKSFLKHCYPVRVTFVKRNLDRPEEVQSTEKMEVFVRIDQQYLGLLKGANIEDYYDFIWFNMQKWNTVFAMTQVENPSLYQ